MDKKQVKKVLTDKFNKTKSTAAVKKCVEEEMTGDVQSIGYEVYNESFATTAEKIALNTNMYLTVAYIPEHERDKIDSQDFAGPSRTYPCSTPEQVRSAADLVGHSKDPSQVKRKIIQIAKRKGFEYALPDSWKDPA